MRLQLQYPFDLWMQYLQSLQYPFNLWMQYLLRRLLLLLQSLEQGTERVRMFLLQQL